MPVFPDVLPPAGLDRASLDADPSFKLARAPLPYYQKFFGSIYLPAFNIATIWLGASEIVVQFNYSVGQPFSFPDWILLNVNPTFVLAVRYRVGNTVTRFLLWRYIGEILYYPLYTGQTIKPNFTLEIWSVFGQPNVINVNTSLSINTSIMHKPLDISMSGGTFIESQSTQCPTIKAPVPFNGAGPNLLLGNCSANLTN